MIYRVRGFFYGEMFGGGDVRIAEKGYKVVWEGV